ncbi:MAG: T9SS type A sorting domain-containing protein [Lentimicrobium sp.]|nr:T9SS type A sorting domain-containing protein [Lentimicrobium sp.]
MKRNLLFLFVLISVMANSQVTLSHSDYQNAFSIGTIYLTYSTPIGGEQFEVFVGEPSTAAQTWDLTALPLEYLAISHSIEPSSAPFIGDFPTSNLVLYEKYWFAPGDTMYSWNYKELQSDRLLLHGQSDEFSVYMTWDPPAIQAKFPMTLGTTWLSERDSTYIMPEVYTISETEAKVDAFGTLIITSGEFPCLRLCQDHRTISHTPAGVDTSMTRSFNFYTQGMIEVHIGSIYEDQFDLTTIWTSGVKLSGRQGSVGISPVNPPLPSLLTGIYPNPLADKAEIHYTLKNNAKVKILVSDLSGREVAVLFNDYKTVGDHVATLDASGISPGIYLCAIQANGMVETNKLVICK